MLSQIISIPSGYVNSVNDAAIGLATAPPFGPSYRAGQLGKRFEGVLGENINANPAIGVIYGGGFRYVRLAAASLVPIIGQTLFWDVTVADNLYQVTTSESGGVDAAVFPAGVCLTPNLTPGNYTVIQDYGRVPMKFRAVLTDAGKGIGAPVYTAGAGGADLGFADVIEDVTGASRGDVSVFQRRFLGRAAVAPVGGGLTDVDMTLELYRA